MQIKEIIILAGGLGTRLLSAVPDLPKCMAPVNGVPFISYVINYFLAQGIERFIFALGHKSEFFEDFIASTLPASGYSLSIEPYPLGTGGAVKLSCTKTSSKNVLVTNGDTLFKIDVSALSKFHTENEADCTLSLKPMQQFNRYGVVDINKAGRVINFKEKEFYEQGLINGGVYALNVKKFTEMDLPEKFSFEKEYLEKYYRQNKISGLIQDGYFIDIGVPEDYERAQKELHPVI